MSNTGCIEAVDLIAKRFKSKVSLDSDKEHRIVVYIKKLDRIKSKKYLSNLEGRGYTYNEACIDFIIHALDKNYNLRYDKKFYATQIVRKIIKKNTNIYSNKILEDCEVRENCGEQENHSQII